LTIGEWSARWWEWVLSIPPGSNPQLDGVAGKASQQSDHCDQGQQDPVWFLAGNYGGTTSAGARFRSADRFFSPSLTIRLGRASAIARPPATEAALYRVANTRIRTNPIRPLSEYLRCRPQPPIRFSSITPPCR